MKKVYSIVLMLTMMIVALSFISCGGDDDEYDGDYDDYDYLEITINGDKYVDEYWGSGILWTLEMKQRNGLEVYPFGAMSVSFPISSQDWLQYHVIAGYTTEDMKLAFPNSKGTYEIITNRDKYFAHNYSDNVGMVITGANASHRTVTSGAMKITKITKFKDPSIKYFYGRDDCYITEGTFSFVLTDNWDRNENKIYGKFRITF